MTIEIFTQFDAISEQLEQQYRLRYRFCIGHLGWTGRNVVDGMEYDEYDMPSTVYLIYRDQENTARAMARFTPCTQPFMIKDHWPELIADEPMPHQKNQWEITRLCVERCLGKDIGNAIKSLMHGSEIIARSIGIDEYWWLSPKHRIESLVSHNHIYAGPGLQIGDEFCFAGKSYAHNMVAPQHRNELDSQDNVKLPRVAA